MIWSQVKGYVAKENKTFKLNEINELATKGIDKVSTQNWKNYINHVIKKEKEISEIDGLVDEIWENQNFIISMNSDSSDSDSKTMSADDSCKEIIIEVLPLAWYPTKFGTVILKKRIDG
ncbi:hypothetical protein TNCV_160971 [Trichonephila clavipes]|nr:hypothetical protein TNCV_160971 [Trichonephila clavipes]